MAVKAVSKEQVLQQARATLGLPVKMDAHLDEALLAAMVRRTASILRPCSRATIATAMREYLHQLDEAGYELDERIEDAIEGAIAGGDLLELSQVAIEDDAAKGTWVFPAPPGYVQRADGSVLLVGMTPDEDAMLPADLNSRIVYNRYGRSISTQQGEALATKLAALGLLAHSEDTWLKAPPEESSETVASRYLARLAAAPPSGSIIGLSILNPERDVRFYRGRWVLPKKESGQYVARRPQAHGAALWGFVSLQDGVAMQFIDFPTRAGRWRACDEAWHLQMALDARKGQAQRYHVRPASEGSILDFYSPVPAWAERRLNIVGHSCPANRCLFSYWVPSQAVQAEERFLEKRLWLTRDNDKQQPGG